MEESKIIETIDEEGNPVKFELYNIVEFEGKDYALLMPIDEESDDLVLMHIIVDGDEYSFETIDDDDEFERVSEYIENLEDEE